MFFSRSNKALADSLDRATDPQDPLVNRLLRLMATQAMSNALYFSTGSCPQDQYYHYGTGTLFLSVVIEITFVHQPFLLLVWETGRGNLPSSQTRQTPVFIGKEGKKPQE